MAATMVFGGLAVSRMGVSQFPDVDFPTLNIQVGYEGAAPEIVEHDVVEPIEEALVQVEGIKSLTSTARQGSGNITLELDVNRDVDAALQEVQTRVAQIQNQLPRNIDPPTISKNNPEDNPILWIGVAGPFPRAMLADYARLRRRRDLHGRLYAARCPNLAGCAQARRAGADDAGDPQRAAEGARRGPGRAHRDGGPRAERARARRGDGAVHPRGHRPEVHRSGPRVPPRRGPRRRRLRGSASDVAHRR